MIHGEVVEDMFKPCRVFVGSPGGLELERKSVLTVADRVNRVAAHPMGWHVEVLRWEDDFPEAGRPQALINENVDRADVFLGILGDHWGSETGEFSSGFEEEFVRAASRHGAEGSPRIWLYFREIADALLKDPGDQLKRSLAFREKIETEKRFYYRRFATADEFAELVNDHLTAHFVKDALQKNVVGGRKISTQQSAPYNSDENAMDEVDQSAIPESVAELTAAFEFASKSASDGELPGTAEDEEEKSAARVGLFVGSWLTRLNAPPGLDTHFLNFAFRFRDDISLTPPEAVAVLDAIVTADDPTVPGWALFRNISGDGLLDYLFKYRLSASKPDVTLGTLQLATRMARGGVIDLEALEKLALSDKEKIREAALKCLAARADPESLGCLKRLVGEGVDGAIEGYLLAAAARSTETAVQLLLDHPGVVKPRDLEARVRPKFSRDDVMLLLRSGSETEQELALLVAGRRRLLRKSDVMPYLGAKSLSVRAAAVQTATAMGWQLPLEDTLEAINQRHEGQAFSAKTRERAARAFLRKRSYDELSRISRWYSFEGIDAYWAIATEHFDKVAEELRAGLKDRFASWDVRARAEFASDLGLTPENVPERFGNLRESSISDLEAIASEALGNSGKAADVKLLEPLLEAGASSTVKPVFTAIGKLGGAAVGGRLLERAATDDTFAAFAAGPVAEIGRRHPVVLKRALRSENLLIAAAAARVAGERPKKYLSELRLLLENDNWWLRKHALAIFVESWEDDELLALLNEITPRHHYYNVSAWLDRVLFAPEPIRSEFRAMLRE